METLLDDDAFLDAFIDGTLPKTEFRHVGHVRVAWLLLRQLPVADAIERTCIGIRRLAEGYGATAKFHRTRTEALVRLIAKRDATKPGEDWDAFLERNADLLADARGLLARHYSAALLDSDEARLNFAMPDLKPLPK